MKNLSSLFVCLIAAVVVWALFFPANMNPDSIAQYHQASSGRFNDWHPPAMAVILSAIIACGGDIGLLMLFQSMAGIFGLWAFSYAIMYDSDRHDIMTVTARSWVATIVTVLFLIPINPFVFYITTFTKDAWLMIILLWIGAFTFRIHGSGVVRRLPVRILEYGLLVALMGLAPHIRHNALVLLPPLCFVCLLTVGRSGFRTAWFPALLPIAAFVLWYPLFYWTVLVEQTLPSTQVKALDLIGICVLDSAARADLPYTDACLADDYRARYRFGDYTPIYLDAPSIVKSKYISGHFGQNKENEYLVDYGIVAGPKKSNESLDRDYRVAIRKHAWTLIKVKLLSFWPLLGIQTYRNDNFTINTWVMSGIVPNSLGLKSNTVWEWPRRKVTNLAWRTAHSPLRWISGVHAVWLVVTLSTLCIALLRHRRSPTPTQHWLFHAVWLTVPLSYYLSYLLATPCPEYRFMYASTINVQIYILSVLINLIFAKTTATRDAGVHRFPLIGWLAALVLKQARFGVPQSSEQKHQPAHSVFCQ